MMNRRKFLRDSAAVLAGIGTSSVWLSEAAAQSARRGKALVVLLQRGAADGLNIVVPFSDPQYYSLRPTIAAPAPGKPNGVIDLDGRFGFHPALKPLKSLWDNGQLAIVEATGSPDFGRSHFDAQAYMESGTSGVKTGDGWLNRAMKTPQFPTSTFRVVSMGSNLPLILRGDTGATAIGELAKIELGTGGSAIFEQMYMSSGDPDMSRVGKDAFELLRKVEVFNDQTYFPSNGARYLGGQAAQDLRQVARLIKADVGLEAAFVEITGWDHHSNEASQLSSMLNSLANALSSFATDMGDRMEDIVLVTLSEFGRTARENGNGGTDHGHGSLMMTIGGPVRGGKVYGEWPGLDPEQLFERRDLAVTTDYRDVLSEILTRHMGVTNLSRVFPEFKSQTTLGFIRS
jgi:uncharacterized protein (DUF1501 family)